jgi:hypothetical protein
MGKVHFTPLMYPLIGNLMPNVQFLVDDPPEVVYVCHRGPSVHMPVILYGNRVTCSARSRLTQFPSPNYPRHHLTHTYHCLVPLQNITFKKNFPTRLHSPTQKEEGDEEGDIDFLILVPTRHRYSLDQTEKAGECLFHSFFCAFYIV